MLFKSALITQASGSIGGMTASRNKGGAYFRARALPTNPNTPEQQAVRGFLGALANEWANILTPAQRVLWDFYAYNVPVINKVGDSINLTGQQMFIRSNVPRLQAGLARVDGGPTIFNLGAYTNPSFSFDAANDEVDVTFDNTDDWANEDGSSMLIFASRPQNVTINYFKGPYRFAGRIDGDATTAPTSPAAIAAPFAAVAGQRVFVRVSVSRADGRLSAPFRGQGLAF